MINFEAGQHFLFLQPHSPYLPLSAFNSQSFAFTTIRHRLPLIVTQCIDTLARYQNINQEIKETEELERQEKLYLIEQLSRLKVKIYFMNNFIVSKINMYHKF